ncbi:cupin domain-containing protein [Altererythrobacter sp. Root672]|uniref:cupin domain-containing protein n=1 Tax=Altererythrobacter sp. Root672 TaxID=1736584 RepID=UPI0006FBC6E7|nr:cupin domain-containing protein [Altererythrobacter sp. Root672]KRA82612.1 cupin [Altererythrobacter sp. Root672]
MRRIYLFAIVLAAGSAAILPAQAPRPPGSTRTDLQRHDLSIPGWETIQARIDFIPGASFPAHRHPGEEIIYVLEGTLEYQLEGQPPKTLEAGDVLYVPARVFHSARNIGTTQGSELATYVVEKGKPLTEFAE